MKSRWRLILSAAAALAGGACAGLLGPDPLPTGVVVTASAEAVGVRDVEGVGTDALILRLTRDTEILVDHSGRGVQVGAATDLEPGARIRFETEGPVWLSLPPQYQAVRIWVRRP